MKEILKGLNVYLIGMMGAGKTTVGKKLAEKLAYRFIDTDEMIELVTGKTVSQIFASEKEEGFRHWETKVLNEVSPYLRLVVATGGGVVLRRENWGYLRDGIIIYLDVAIATLTERLKEDKSRPLLQQEDLERKLNQLHSERESLYQQADIIISIEKDDTPDEVVSKILEAIPSKVKIPVNPDLN